MFVRFSLGFAVLVLFLTFCDGTLLARPHSAFELLRAERRRLSNMKQLGAGKLKMVYTQPEESFVMLGLGREGKLLGVAPNDIDGFQKLLDRFQSEVLSPLDTIRSMGLPTPHIGGFITAETELGLLTPMLRQERMVGDLDHFLKMIDSGLVDNPSEVLVSLRKQMQNHFRAFARNDKWPNDLKLANWGILNRDNQFVLSAFDPQGRPGWPMNIQLLTLSYLNKMDRNLVYTTITPEIFRGFEHYMFHRMGWHEMATRTRSLMP